MADVSNTPTTGEQLLQRGINVNELEWQRVDDNSESVVIKSNVQHDESMSQYVMKPISYTGRDNQVVDRSQWNALPPYDKTKGHVYHTIVEELVRDVNTQSLTSIVRQLPIYDIYLPPVPTPILYHHHPIGTKELTKISTNMSIYEMKYIISKGTYPTKATLIDITHNSSTNNLNYHIELDNGSTIIEEGIHHFDYLDWPPQNLEHSDIRALDPNTLKGTRFEHLLVKHPDVAEAHGIRIDDIIHKYTK